MVPPLVLQISIHDENTGTREARSLYRKLPLSKPENVSDFLAVHSMAQETPSVYVQVSWDMSWKRLCNFLDFFSKQLSEQLFQKKGKFPLQIKPLRIRFMNSESHCQGNGNGEDAILDFFVSKSEKDLGSNDVHRNLTIDAYKLLYDYWKNQKMVLLDVFFIGKVTVLFYLFIAAYLIQHFKPPPTF